jgi:hypothetical protein
MQDEQRPDITRDRIYVVCGASMIGPIDSHVAITDLGRVLMTYVETEETEIERNCRVAGRPFYPHEKAVGISHELHVGTVDEHVEYFREALTRCFHEYCLTPPAGEPQPVIPWTGATHLGPQNVILARNGVDAMTKVPPRPDVLAKNDAARAAIHGVTPRQSAATRDKLRRMVGNWIQYAPKEGEYYGDGPTDRPSKVQQLIDALTVLRDDHPDSRTPTDPALPDAVL